MPSASICFLHYVCIHFFINILDIYTHIYIYIRIQEEFSNTLCNRRFRNLHI